MPETALTVPAIPARRDAHRGRLFRKYLLLILTLVTGALLTSGAISVYFSYQEIKTALSNLQREKAVAAASRIEQYIHQIEQQLAYAALPQLDAADVELRRIEYDIWTAQDKIVAAGLPQRLADRLALGK